MRGEVRNSDEILGPAHVRHDSQTAHTDVTRCTGRIRTGPWVVGETRARHSCRDNRRPASAAGRGPPGNPCVQLLARARGELIAVKALALARHGPGDTDRAPVVGSESMQHTGAQDLVRACDSQRPKPPSRTYFSRSFPDPVAAARKWRAGTSGAWAVETRDPQLAATKSIRRWLDDFYAGRLRSRSCQEMLRIVNTTITDPITLQLASIASFSRCLRTLAASRMSGMTASGASRGLAVRRDCHARSGP